MAQAAMLPFVELEPHPHCRYFSGHGCVVVDGDQRHVLVGATLIGSFEVGDIAGRNVILVGLSRDPDVHLGKLAEAFEIGDETLRRTRRRFEADGLRAIVDVKHGGREKIVTPKLEKRLFQLFDEGASITEAQARLKRRVSRAVVGRVRQRWSETRRASHVEQRAEPPSMEQVELATAAPVSVEEAPSNELVSVESTQEPVVSEAPVYAQPSASAELVSEEAVTPAQPLAEWADSEQPPRVRRERPLELVINRRREGQLVQHAGAWVMLGMLERFGVYDVVERLRVDGEAAAAQDQKPFVTKPVLRIALDAVVIALTLVEMCVEGVRRIATPSVPTLLRSNAALSPEWTRTVIGRFAHYRGEMFHLAMTFSLIEAARHAGAERAVFYVDNHLRPYTGKHTIRKGWRMQDKRVRPGISDYWVHDEDGRPLLRFNSPSHESLVQQLRPIGGVLRAGLDHAGAAKTKLTLVFDRAGAFANEMAALRDAKFEFVTYERAPYGLLPKDAFDRTLELRGETIRFTEAKKKNLRKGRGRVRRIVLLMPDGEQVNILAASTASAEELIVMMLARWARQENQFKHGVERWGVNQLDGRSVDAYPEDAVIPNPARRRLDHALHIARVAEGEALRKLARVDADDPRRDKLDAEVKRLQQQQRDIDAQRELTPKKAPVRDTPLTGKLKRHRDRYKLVIDTLRTLLANVESELAARLGPHLYRAAEAKKTLANLFAAPGFVRLTSRSIRIALAPAGTPREHQAFATLLRSINAARLRLPGDVSRRVLRFRLLEQRDDQL